VRVGIHFQVFGFTFDQTYGIKDAF
jgi:hypothetical protein